LPDTSVLDPNLTAPTADEPESTANEEPLEEGLGDWNERLEQDLQDQLVKLATELSNEFKYPRRLEVMKDWQARMFWREMQHLKWNWGGECWDVAFGPGAYDGRNSDSLRDSSVLYSTNMYQGFGEAFLAIITQSVPSLRFEPEDPGDAADIETARASESLRKIIQHENDPVQLMTRAAYYGWNGGRMHGWTRWEVDKRTGMPRETQSLEGSMEVKVPIIAGCQTDYEYLQFSTEYSISTVRAKVASRSFDDPDYWKKVKGGTSGDGQNSYERMARISAKQGISMRSAGGDAYANLVTTQRTWMRPTIFYRDCVEEKNRETLKSLFPHGCYLETDNGVYTGSRDANMDDEWAVENIMEGDGAFRNGKGTCLISIQERANDTINIAQDVYEKTQPASHWDDKIFDIDAMRRQRSMPGARYGVNLSEMPPGDTLAGHYAFEPAAAVSADMLTYLKELMTDIPEFLTGISAILFGSDTQGDKSGKALSIQQAAAMGRIGLPFRVLKRLYAKMMEQAVRCAARNRKQDFSQGVPDDKGNVETIQVRIEQLAGKIRCFPDSDENYPESWTQKRQTYQQLMVESAANPILAQSLALPKNQELGKKLVGLAELEIAGADSWNKQMQEINIMLAAGPPVQQPPQVVPNPMTGEPEIMPSPPQTTLPIDPEWDDNAAEYQTIKDWVNSAAGQKAIKENPQGVQNVKLHGEMHKQVLQQQAMQQMMQQAAAAPPPAPPKGAAPPQKAAA